MQEIVIVLGYVWHYYDFSACITCVIIIQITIANYTIAGQRVKVNAKIKAMSIDIQNLLHTYTYINRLYKYSYQLTEHV